MINNLFFLILFNLRIYYFRYILEELNVVQSSAKSMLTCSNILLSSLKRDEEKKDKIISYFYSAVKTLIYDIVSVQDRRVYSLFNTFL